MDKILATHKINCIFTVLALSVLSFPTYAAHGILPVGWKAHPPIHLKSRKATLAPAGFSPSQIKTAYGFPTAFQGAGQVIAIVDAYDDPNIEADLGVFSTTFGLPACTTANGCFTKIYASGTQPAGNAGWGLEISLDVEWAHAIAPLAKILLIEAATNGGNDLYEAVNVAIQNHPSAISLSWGGPEFSTETSFDYIFQGSAAPIVVSSGDSGTGVSYPAASPYVLSTGGTQLTLNSNGSYQSETAWSGSGGGLSLYEKVPAYQSGFPIPQDTTARGVPDVAYNASPSSGYSIYDSYGEGGWLVVGGTSASAPQWAASIAVANSARATNLTNFNTAIYKAASASYSTLFHDITSGTNGSCGYYCTAQAGYDYVTGLGTLQAANLVSYFSSPGCTHANPSVSFSPTTQASTAGGSVSYTFTVVNKDTTTCSASNFSLSSAVPSGFSGGFAQTALTLSPGASGTTTLKVNSAATSAAGTYQVSGTATNTAATSSTAQTTASYVLTAAAQAYAYTVYVGYPFKPVVINGSITCPNPGTENPACLISGQAVGSVMTITGSGSDKCSLSIQAGGNIVVNAASSSQCYAGLSAATATEPGVISLPSGF